MPADSCGKYQQDRRAGSVCRTGDPDVQGNGFQTIHFSEDLGGLPSSLFIAVYLKKSDVDKGEPVLRIRYEPLSCAGNSNEESDEEYTIADPPSEYRLTVEDGR